MRSNYKLKLLAALLMLPALFFSCRKDMSRPAPAALAVAPRYSANARFANETVNTWVTTTDQSKLLALQPNINFAADGGTNPITITVDENTTYQTIDGFGYALTGGSASLINGLGANQSAFLTDIFSTASGHVASSFVRITIGASDLSSSDFTYDDMPSGQTDVNLNNSVSVRK
jgi:glucosylceramidase